MKGLGSIRLRILLVDLCWGLVAILLFASRYGYSFATGDQDELLPFLYSLLDPALYKTDWFVQSQLASFSVRTYFVWLLAGIASLVPVAWAVWLLFILLALWIALMVLRLARRLTGSQTAAVVALLVAVVGTHKWTLGGNELLYTMLVPEMAAWALVLPSVLLFLDRRHVLAAVLLGMACWFQLLAGLLTAGVLVVLRAFDGQESFKRRMVQVVVFGAAFAAAALPALIPMAVQQLESVPGADNRHLFYILSAFRNPFHHLPFSFGPLAWLKFTLLLAGGSAGLFLLRKRLPPSGMSLAVRFTVVTLVVCLIGVVFTEGIPVLLISKFQVFKLTVLVKLFAVIYLSAGICLLLPRREVDPQHVPTRLEAYLAIGALLVSLGIAAASAGRMDLPWGKPKDDPWSRIENWARWSTPVDALFAIPPSNGSFRSRGRRAIVVNYGAFPFRDADMTAWYDRLLDVAPIHPPRRGLGVKPVLDSAFFARPAADWDVLSQRYGIEYVVTLSDSAERMPFPPRFRAEPWMVVELLQVRP